jgi:uncharacterized protein YqjF (DUF2071 family)
MQTINLNDALGVMKEREPFQLKFVTADRTLKTGGKIIELTNAVEVGAAHHQKNNETITVKQLGNSNHPYPVHIHLITEFNHKKVFI